MIVNGGKKLRMNDQRVEFYPYTLVKYAVRLRSVIAVEIITSVNHVLQMAIKGYKNIFRE